MKNQPVKGALAITAAGLMFAMMGACIKLLSSQMNNEMIVFFRNLCVMLFIGPIFFFKSRSNSVKTSHFTLHLSRSLSGLAAMYFYFYTLSKMPLAEAILISYTSPFFIPIVAFFWLGEPLLKKFIFASIAGFIGIILILKPGTHIFNPAGIYGLIAAVSASVAMVSIRKMSDTEPALRIVFYYTLISTVISFFPALFSWEPLMWKEMIFVILIGITGFSGQIFVTTGYSLAPSAQVGPFTYTTIIFGALLGIFFFNERFDRYTMLGGIIIISAGIIALKEKNKS